MLDFINIELLFLLNVFLLIWLIVITVLFVTFSKNKRKISKEIKDKGLEKILDKILDENTEIKTDIEKIYKNNYNLGRISSKSITKIGIIRYNPFSDAGGDQSFSIALLNSKDGGIVLSSLHGRKESRIYAKPVESGESKYHLTDEEKEAIRRAREYSEKFGAQKEDE